MTIDEMKAIAGARSKGRWLFIKNIHGYTTHDLYDDEIKGTWTSWDSKDRDDADARFSAMAASKMDALLELAASAKEWARTYMEPESMEHDRAVSHLFRSITELEK